MKNPPSVFVVRTLMTVQISFTEKYHSAFFALCGLESPLFNVENGCYCCDCEKRCNTEPRFPLGIIFITMLRLWLIRTMLILSHGQSSLQVMHSIRFSFVSTGSC